MVDEEFRAAFAAFVRSWLMPEWFAENTEEDFEDMVNQLINQKGSSPTQMLRSFHAKHGRYPTFEEIRPPETSFIGIVPGIE